jgi:hypothetical protein
VWFGTGSSSLAERLCGAQGRGAVTDHIRPYPLTYTDGRLAIDLGFVDRYHLARFGWLAAAAATLVAAFLLTAL